MDLQKKMMTPDLVYQLSFVKCIKRYRQEYSHTNIVTFLTDCSGCMLSKCMCRGGGGCETRLIKENPSKSNGERLCVTYL